MRPSKKNKKQKKGKTGFNPSNNNTVQYSTPSNSVTSAAENELADMLSRVTIRRPKSPGRTNNVMPSTQGRIRSQPPSPVHQSISEEEENNFSNVNTLPRKARST